MCFGNVFDPATAPYDGYTIVISDLYSEHDEMHPTVDVLNMNGQVVQVFENPIPGSVFGKLAKPMSNGHIMALVKMKQPPSKLVELDWDGNVVWQYTSSPFNPEEDFERLANGNTLLISQVPEIWPNIRPDPLLNNYIHEVGPAGSILWTWSAAANWDELPFSDTERAYLSTADFPWIFHMNSIAMLPPNQWEALDSRFAQGNLLVSLRESNKVFIIDRSTGKVVWSFSGAIGQHHARMIPPGLAGAGNILLLDNGSTFGAPPVTRNYSRVLELDPTTGQVSWSYEDPDGFFSPILGSVQRLPNGNTLIGEGVNGIMREIDPGGNVLWTLALPHARIFNRAYRVDYTWPPGPIQFRW